MAKVRALEKMVKGDGKSKGQNFDCNNKGKNPKGYGKNNGKGL